MKKIFLAFSLLASLLSFAQPAPVVPGYTNINDRYIHLSLYPRSFGAPAGPFATLQNGQWVRAGALFADTVGSDKGLKVWLDGGWKRLIDSSTASTLGAKFGQADTVLTADRYVNLNENEFATRNGTLTVGKQDSLGVRLHHLWSTLSSTNWTVTGSSTSTSGDSLIINGTTQFTSLIWTGGENWHTQMYFRSKAKTNALQRIYIALIPNTSSSSSTRKMQFAGEDSSMYLNYGINSGSSTPDFSNRGNIYFDGLANDTYFFEFWSYIGKLRGRVTNLRTGQTTQLDIASVPIGNVSRVVISATGSFSFYNAFDYYIDAPRPLYVFSGTSITNGVGVSNPADRWPVRAMYQFSNPYMMYAGGGETTADMILRIDEWLNFIGGDLVLEYITNDLNTGVPIATTMGRYRRISDSALVRGKKIILISPLPMPNDNAAWIDSLQQIATDYGWLYVDANTLLKAGNGGGFDRNTKYAFDAVHFNAKGMQVIADKFIQTAVDSLKRIPPFKVGALSRSTEISSYMAINKDGELVLTPSGYDNSWIRNIRSADLSEIQHANIVIDGRVIFNGIGTQNISDFMVSGVNGPTNPDFWIYGSDTRMKSAIANLFTCNGWQINNIYSQIENTKIFMVGTSFFQPFQTDFKITRFQPGSGTPATLTLDNDVSSGAAPSGYVILDMKNNGVRKASVDKEGIIRTISPSGYSYNVNGSLGTNDWDTKGRVDSLIAVVSALSLSNPMTTTGDIIYSSSGSGTPARLGIGTNGQVLKTSAGGIPEWADETAGGGGTAWDDITDPTGSLSLTFNDGEISAFANGSNTETYWTTTNNSMTSGTSYSWTTSSMTSGNILNIVSTSTALAANNEGVNIDISGANGTNAITATGLRSSVTNTNATSGTNVAAAFVASGATTANWALFTGTGSNDGRVNINGATTLTGNYAMIIRGVNDNAGSGIVTLLANNQSANTTIGYGGMTFSAGGTISSSAGALDLTTAGAFQFINHTTNVINMVATVGTSVGGSSFTPTARLHIAAGTTTAGTAPLKFTSGTLLTTAEAGGVEFLTDKYYATITTSAARKELTLNDAALTSGRMPFVTTNGRLTDNANFVSDGSRFTIGGTNPSTSTVDVQGSFAYAVTSVSTNTTLDATHCVVLVDATSGNITITLPAAGTANRRIYIVKKIDATANTVTIDGNGSETIDGATTQVISAQWASYTVQSNGTNFFVL
jgi:hypothetical protein